MARVPTRVRETDEDCRPQEVEDAIEVQVTQEGEHLGTCQSAQSGDHQEGTEVSNVDIPSQLSFPERTRLPQRSRTDLIADMLEMSNESSNEAMLMRKCALTLPQFSIYKDYLVSNGFLKVTRSGDGAETFNTTEKGKEFLKDYGAIKSIFGKMPS